jgi:hypothetical protein
MTTKLHKNGDRMAVQTDAKSESEFLTEYIELLAKMCDDGTYAGDWEFQLSRWIPQSIEVVLHYRGYKSEAQIRSVIVSGDGDPAQVVAAITPRGIELQPGPASAKEAL